MKPLRIQSIDALRGLIMIIMALDHIRDFFHFDAFLHNPLDLRYSPYPLFMTRWITHFCAPTFILLTGVSAYLYGLKHTKAELSRFLFTRGLWLVFLEITVVAIGWKYNFDFQHTILMVIWAIGMAMIFLSAMVWLPYAAILGIGLLIVCTHNLFDSVHVTPGTFWSDVWMILHQQGYIAFNDKAGVFIFYTLLPYFGLICAGYGFGKVFAPQVEAAVRKRTLLFTGLVCIVAFIVLRLINKYGDPQPWDYQVPWRYTFASFINCTKYPVSLQFALMILGPAILILYALDGVQNRLTNFLVTIGKVPMFYYIVHIYLIHAIAMVMDDKSPNTPFGVQGKYHLWTVYVIWVCVVAALYLPCKWYGKYKSAHPENWWLSYI